METQRIQMLDPKANICPTLPPARVCAYASLRPDNRCCISPDKMFLDVLGIPQASVSCRLPQLPTRGPTKEYIDQPKTHKNLLCVSARKKNKDSSAMKYTSKPGVVWNSLFV